MSHHFDSPTAIADGRINLCDFYVFPAAPGTLALILTVNPDAGRSSPTTFRPDAHRSASIPRSATAAFPYLSAPRPADLPALADLFGLRGQHSEPEPAVDLDLQTDNR